MSVVPVSLCAALISDADYVEYWGTAKYFDSEHLQMILLLIVAFGAGCLAVKVFTSRKRAATPTSIMLEGAEVPWRLLYFCFQAGFVVVVIAYLIWLASCAAQGITTSLLVSAIKGEQGSIFVAHDLSIDAHIPGITTATQFGMGVALLGTLLGWKFGWRKVGLQLATLIGLSLIRAVFLCERVAFIELILPSSILLLHLRTGASDTNKFAKRILAFLPIIAVATLYFVFTGTEYLRSWTNFFSLKNGNQSVMWFGFLRLLGYYVTAFNNGVLYFKSTGQLDVPYYTLQWFWRFPPTKLIYPDADTLNDSVADRYLALLKEDANPEFNNYCGVLASFFDYGLIGSLILWFVIGIAGMILYQSFVRRSLAGLLLYPFFFHGLTEVMRGFYWGDSRAFPSWIFLFALLIIARTARKPSTPPISFDAGFRDSEAKSISVPSIHPSPP